MPHDPEMSCAQIDSEIRGNNQAIRVRVDEDAETQNKNIVVGSAALLVFLPMAFAMDFNGAAETEARAYEQRNGTLTGLAGRKQCQTTAAITMAEAAAERSARIAAAQKTDDDVPGVKTPTDQRLHQAQATAVPSPQVAAKQPVGRARLQELMAQFLRGEISKEEYERLRAG